MSAAVREKVKALERRHANLRRQANKLTHTRDQLVLKDAVLASWIETLTLLQVQLAVHQGTALLSSQSTNLLLQQELQLLTEVTRNEDHACPLFDAAAQLPHPGVDTVSVAGDPMACLRQGFALGPLPGAATWTPLELARMLRDTVLHCGLLLNQQQLPLVHQSTVSMKQEWDRWVVVLTTVHYGPSRALPHPFLHAISGGTVASINWMLG